METPATTFAPVIKFHFGADARDAEGAGGTITHVIIAAETRVVTAVGVRFGLFGHEVYAPVERVSAATDAGVVFNVTRDELAKDGQRPAGIRLGGDLGVTQNGKRLGKLAQATFNGDTHALLHLIVDRGLSGEFVFSARAIRQLTASGVEIEAASDGGRPPLTQLRLDADLREDVLKAIESYPRLHVDLEGINIAAIDGSVWLRGHVSSELNRRLIQDLVGGVEGIAELHNELMTDPELAARISRAFAYDPRTAEERIGVYPTLGRVHLRGAVRTAVAREAAEQLASATPGVGEILNELHVDPNANVLPVMASVTNNEDAVPGGR
ncbi:MAG TPA: BON domain-containing protein [Ktedonobacterales bacterium]